MIQRVSSSCGQISTVLQNSVLKKSQTVSFVKKNKKSRQLISLGAAMVSMAKCPIMQSLKRVPKTSSVDLKFQREKRNSSVALSQ